MMESKLCCHLDLQVGITKPSRTLTTLPLSASISGGSKGWSGRTPLLGVIS